MPNIIGIIPARWVATRLEGKALADIAGKPMIQHVYERAKEVPSISRVIVATDDKRIVKAVESFGGEVQMTRADHPCGTDRIAELAQELDCDIVVNIQGDEPLIKPQNIETAITPLLVDETIPMGTLCVKITSQEELNDPSVVKVVTDNQGFALYFSRYPIPYNRDSGKEVEYYHHIGLYVYRKDFLIKFAKLPPTPLEKAESLEQLRALEYNNRIIVSEVSEAITGIDTPEQLENIRNYFRNHKDTESTE